ncbi:laccase, multicopper oxidase, benzenediol:oxygen oxidorectuctase [Neophaeococcomyces mojaviensis]|uniref:Laccase, multicopper oxidase, benzenediol:oxygen oxidorectuctase n=1 Tax=Neophaeococcomyces mojaviensis TaxID=3383035 RepID=A0ACC3A1Q4_9EURO|nr:laccase, multicopper oxidase, benzenediol:oxygen oxidorectuctase [Knufia sp. JES_112]
MHCHSFILFFLSLVQFISARALPGRSGDAKLVRIGANGPNRYPSHYTANITNSNCFNSPTSRQCWGGGYSINTNVDSTWPRTGRTVRYNLEIQNITLALDGHPKQVLAVNGQYPGPTIRARWGDTIQVTVKNSMQNNGTSMHWHGVRQWYSNPMDGTNGITECPLAPGQSRTYTFLATQYGTTWYHSHHSSQYSQGVVGTIIIDGPTSANWDYDLGVMPVTDWYYSSAFGIVSQLSVGAIRGPPPADNVLINGTNVNATSGGAYHRNTIQKGKKYLLRFVNTATQDGYKIGLDGHNLTVVAADFVPIEPWTTDWLYIGVGQRYDVIVEANQPIGSYWMHFVPQASCSNNKITNAVSIFTYQGANSTTPSDSTRNNGPSTSDCLDPNDNLIPYVQLDVPKNQTIPASSRLDVNFTIVQGNGTSQTLVQWNLNFTAIHAQWNKPTLEYVREGNTSYPRDMNLIELSTANAWSFWVIQAVPNLAPAQPHPIHLHGHDFYVLGAGTGTYDNSQTLNYGNPPRRDVAMLPANGYLVLAFITDNPGAWLMHCHVAWHIDLGLGAQFLEQKNKIRPLLDATVGWNNQCSSWDRYDDTAIYKETGSGL